jgi:hypothetical protein
MAKFNIKAAELYGKVQPTYGTAVVPIAADVIAALELSYKQTNETDSFEYSGDITSRDTQTDITDSYAEVAFKTFLPVSVTAGGPIPALTALTRACGANPVTVATTSLEWTNATVPADIVSMEFRRTTVDVVTSKTYKVKDAQGTMGLEVEVGKRAMLDFTFMGNKNGEPVQAATLVGTYGTQKTAIAPILRAENLTIAEIGAVNSVGTLKNVCFQKLTAQNIFGFDYERVLLGCGDGFSRSAVSNDFQITIVEDAAGTAFDPFGKLGTDFSFTLGYGSVAGSKVLIHFNQAQLIDVQSTEVKSWAGLTLSFKNRSKASIKFL